MSRLAACQGTASGRHGPGQAGRGERARWDWGRFDRCGARLLTSRRSPTLGNQIVRSASAVVEMKMWLPEDDPGCRQNNRQDRDDVDDPYVSHGGDLAYPRNLG
jgi:hypothetical protein